MLVLAAALIGFAAGRYGRCRPHHDKGPASSVAFNPLSSMLRIEAGSLQENDNYYAFLIHFAPDSVTVSSIDTLNSSDGMAISCKSPVYILQSLNGTIDTLPSSVYVQHTYTLVCSSVYSRFGVVYGQDVNGQSYAFRSEDIISMQGDQQGNMGYGIVSLENYESPKP